MATRRGGGTKYLYLSCPLTTIVIAFDHRLATDSDITQIRPTVTDLPRAPRALALMLRKWRFRSPVNAL